MSDQFDEFYLQNFGDMLGDFFEFDVDLLGIIPHMATVILVAKEQTLASADIELRELASKAGNDILIRLHDSEKQILTMIKVSVHFSKYKFTVQTPSIEAEKEIGRKITAQNSSIDVINLEAEKEIGRKITR